MLGGGDGVGRRSINNQAAKLGGGAQIHIINPNAGSANDLQPPAGGLEHLAADLGAAPDNQSVAERDLGAELLGAQVIRAVHVGELLQEVEPRLAELLGDEDGGLGVESRCGEDHDEPGRGEAAEAGGEGEGEGVLGGERKRGGGGSRVSEEGGAEGLGC